MNPASPVRPKGSRRLSRVAASSPLIAAVLVSSSASAAPPSGKHPRLFMSAANVAGYQANAKKSGTAASAVIFQCEDAIKAAKNYTTRGGADGDNWPGTAVRCAFAYKATGDAKYLTQAIKYWKASLDDDQTLGDALGCTASASPNWQSWNGNPPAPPIIRTITHDTGYPMRWYGPYIALTYDWLNDAPGVDAGLLAQTRTCLGAWNDYYTAKGYHRDEAGANYNAGYVIAKTLSAIAIGTDGGADGHLWNEVTTSLYPKLLIGEGLAGATGGVGSPAGALVGGDWAEGWQYGPLSVLEYAVGARALADNGAAMPEMATWTDSLAIRYAHGTVPTMDALWVGGDFDDQSVYQDPSLNVLDAVLAGPSSDTAASWAAFAKQAQGLTKGTYVYNALAELREVAPVDYRAAQPSRWYVARGTRAMYVRSSWEPSAFWGVFTSAPSVVSDHQHLSASNFVLSRGADHLVVDTSNYGEIGSIETNALTVDSKIAKYDYGGSQTPWSKAELAWARGTDDAVYAARSDFARAFDFQDTVSDVAYAHREWVMLPEGEVVTIDRAHSVDAAHAMTVSFHTNTGAGGLALAGKVASGTVGGSKVSIHAVSLSGGTPAISQPTVGECKLSCSYPCAQCDASRIPVDVYRVKVPGPWAVAIHVIDALAAGESDAVVGSLNDDTYDPAPKLNAGVIGAAVYRGTKQSYVVASSAVDGVTSANMTYGVPGAGPSRHAVFDAPEDGSGESAVTATAQGGRCVVSITAGKGFAGRPLLFTLGSAAEGCTPKASTDVAPSEPTPGGTGGSAGTGGSGTGAGGSGTGAGTGTGGTGAGTGTGGTGTGGTGTGGKAGTAGKAGSAGKGGATAAGTSGKGGSSAAAAADDASADDSESSGGCSVTGSGSDGSPMTLALGLGLAIAAASARRRRRAS